MNETKEYGMESELNIFETLTSATFDLAEIMSQGHDEKQKFSFDNESSYNETVNDSNNYFDIIDTGPGFLFRIEKGISTFCIRAIECENLNVSYNELLKGDKLLLSKLKIKELDQLDSVDFFKTENLEILTSMNELFNRRFPINEEVLCNISDPGFSWWLDLNEFDLKVYFNSHGLDRSQRFTRLGPIGNQKILIILFQKLFASLANNLKINQLSCDDKILSIGVASKDNLAFRIFKDIFLFGKYSLNEDVLELEKISPELNYCLYEISQKRKFWLKIEKIIG